MKVLILGGSGMAGHVVALYLREQGYHVDTLAAKRKFDKNTYLLDVTDISNLEKLLNSHSYDVIINCIGLLVKQSEDRKDQAVKLNALLPHVLENFYKNSKTQVIHISSDAVFAGRQKFYKENFGCDGESFYGRSKALGELVNVKDLTIRTSIIGPSLHDEGLGLFNWFLRQKGEIFGFTNITWIGVSTLELAKAIEAAINENLTGIYHLVPKDSISKFDLLTLFNKVFKLGAMTIKPTEGHGLNTLLANTRTDFKYEVPGYGVMIDELKIWMKQYPNIYKHYEER